MSNNIGGKIKELRLSKKMTLKELSELTNLSIGFLSQVERGLTALAITSLEKISRALEVDLSYFFPIKKKSTGAVVRSYERDLFQIENGQFLHYHLSNDFENKMLLPRLIELLPSAEESDSDLDQYQHEGEEFLYVLEGILTLIINGERHDLFPGDTGHFDSNNIHNWANFTNKTTKVLVVNTPNGFNENL